MNREEVKQIVRAVLATFPNWNPKDLGETVNAWYMFLEDENPYEIGLALKNYVKTNNTGFAPSVSQLVVMAHKKDEKQYMSELEAWNLVQQALRRSTYYALEEFEKLPSDVRTAVGSPSQLKSWAMDERFNESVVSSNFQRTYRSVIERRQQYDNLIPEMRTLIDTAKAKMIEG